MAAFGLNPRIARVARKGEEIGLEVACWNIANAKRDEIHSPFFERVYGVIETINGLSRPLDALVLLESRFSGDVAWTYLAHMIEASTHLTYIGIQYTNPTMDSFGKALFVNRKTCIASKFVRTETSEGDVNWGGSWWGNTIVQVELQPIVLEKVEASPGGFQFDSQRVIADKKVTFAFMHFPLARDDRMQVSRWVRDHQHLADVWVGDCNTLEEDGGPEMLKIMRESGLHHHVLDVPWTFKAFPHDLVTKPIAMRPLVNKYSIVTEETETTFTTRFLSKLDHVFTTPYAPPCSSFAVPYTESASDHCMIVCSVVL